MQPTIKGPNILLLDIETAPNTGYTWGKWEQNVIEFVEQWYILCFAYKWLGHKTEVVALPDFSGYKPRAHSWMVSKTKDRSLMRKLWTLLNKADVVIAQNGDAFDIPKIKTRMIYYGMRPPSHFRTIDTLKAARTFAFNSNKLDDLGDYLGEGRKLKHQGFEVWRGCMAGDSHCWDVMKRYNIQDVNLLERIYLRLRPWMKNHPNLAAYSKHNCCSHCQSNNLESRGVTMSQTMMYRNFRCKDCNGWSRLATGKRVAGVTSA